MKLFHAKLKVNTCTVCEIGLFTEEEEEEEEEEEDVGEIGVLAISHMSLKRCILLPLRVLSCLETLVRHVMYLKGLRAAAFQSSEPLHLLRFNGSISAIPT